MDELLVSLRDGPLPLHAAARRIGRSPSATLRRLQQLVEDGWVVRTGERKEARYRLADHVEVEATLHVQGVPVQLAWAASGIDWMFPLAGRCQHRQRVELLLRRAFELGLLHDSTVIVFGSAARWDARPGSDTDILVLTAQAKAWKELAVDTDLESDASIDLVAAPSFDAVPESLRGSVLAEGVTVFSSTSPAWFVEALRHAA